MRQFAWLLSVGLVLSGCAAGPTGDPSAEGTEADTAATEPSESAESSEPGMGVEPAPEWTQPPSPSNIDACKVPDGQDPAAWTVHEGKQVNGKRARGNIGFPLSPTTLPVEGDSNFIAVMVSFDDAPPNDKTPEGFLQDQVDRITEWGEFWSQGKLNFNFQVVDEWVNIPVNHADYPVNRDLPFSERQGNANAIIKMIAAALPADLNYDDLDGVMAYWSPGVDYFEGDLGLQGFEGVALPFPTGAQEVFFWSGNEWWYRDSGQMSAEVKAEQTWAFWIYLMLDSMGLHNHGPGNGWPSGLQQTQTPNQGEFSGAVLGWDEFKLGWTHNDQVHCMRPEDLDSGTQFILQAREVSGGDKRLAIVPFEGEGALVIESRRPVGWSETWAANRSGLLVYFVNTELEIERVDSFTQAGCGSSEEQPKWAYHLYRDGFTGDCRVFDNAFIRPGEQLTYEDVTITLVHSAQENDFVEVMRNP